MFHILQQPFSSALLDLDGESWVIGVGKRPIYRSSASLRGVRITVRGWGIGDKVRSPVREAPITHFISLMLSRQASKACDQLSPDDSRHRNKWTMQLLLICGSCYLYLSMCCAKFPFCIYVSWIHRNNSFKQKEFIRDEYCKIIDK